MNAPFKSLRVDFIFEKTHLLYSGFLIYDRFICNYVALGPYLLFDYIQGQYGDYYYIIIELYWNMFY